MPYNAQDYIKNGVDTNTDNYLKVGQRAFEINDPSHSASFDTSNRNSYMNLARGYLTGDQGVIGDKGADHPLTKAFTQAIGEFNGGTMGKSAVDVSSGQPNAIAAQQAGLPNPGINTSQPNPATTAVQPGSSAVTGTLPGQTTPSTFTSADVAKQYGATLSQGFQNAVNSGTPPPQDAGSARSAVTSFTPPASTPTTTPNVDNFFATNKTLQQQTDDLMNYLSPPEQVKALADEAAKIKTDKDTLAGLNVQDMNIENLKAGTADDIRTEITKTNGFATESQIQALTVARNNTLIKEQNVLRQKINNQQNLINNEQTLLQEDKQMALTQFSQRSNVLQLVQQNQQNILNASRDAIKTLMSTPGGLAAYASDPKQAAQAEKIMGFAPGTISNLAAYPQLHQNVLDNQAAGITTPYVIKGQEIQNTQTGQRYSSTADFQKQTGMTLDEAGKQGLITKYQGGLDQQLQKAQLAEEPLKMEALKANIRQSNASAAASAASAAKTRLETSQLVAGGTSDKIQQKLEQEYRGILAKEVSSRSGTVGTEDAKVAQANHLASLMNQYYDSKSGNYNVPKSQYGELVLGLAGLLSKTGTPTDHQVESITQATAKGDIAKAIGYVTGSTPTGSSQAVLKNLADSIDRQARTAESNREAGLKVLRGLAPTDLEQARRDALEKNTLVPFDGINGVGQQKPSGYVIPLPGGKSLDLGSFEK